MDAKDLLINKLQSQLQDSNRLLQDHQEQLRLKQAELHEAQSQHSATTEQFSQTVEEKNHTIALLESRIKRLLSAVRGSRQERINPDQLLLFSSEEMQQLAKELEESNPLQDPTGNEQDNEPIADDSNPQAPKKSHGRRQLPKNLPREILRHELSEDDRKCPCCGEQRVEFGVETSQQLEFIPATLKIIEHQRVKYACKACQENVAIAAKPPQPIEKGLPGPGLCSYITLSKFGDHLPLYREEDIFSRLGWTLRRSTICEWLSQLGILVEPLVMRMKYLILQSKVIHTDDTKIKMLESPVCREAKFWPYQGDWLHPYVVFDFTLDRTRHGPQRFLKNYQGYLQADAYSGYNCVYAPGHVTEVACWIHTRRHWYESIDNDEVRANTALGYIARLSQIESELQARFPAKNLQGERDFEGIARARQQYSLPILTQFKAWLDREMTSRRILPKSQVKTAFTYTLNQWEALCRYTEQGYLSMDNNPAERMVKYPSIGRKNFLFVGNERAGCNAGNSYSLVTSAKINGVEPSAWLRDVFTRLPLHRDSQAFQQSAAGEQVTSDELDELLPDQWLKAHPDCKWTIDAERREERRQKEKTKRLRRHQFIRKRP